ncbi:MAG: hypothetical protein HYR55_03480 [Acidobacteria bacterium]|nr:hypothetical protein [Acidobacteriota bacterium]
MTLRLQKRSVLEYLTQACQAARAGQAAPSLLPSTPGAVATGSERHTALTRSLPLPVLYRLGAIKGGGGGTVRATRQGGCEGKGVCDDALKFGSSSRQCETGLSHVESDSSVVSLAPRSINGWARRRYTSVWAASLPLRHQVRACGQGVTLINSG